MPLLAALGAAWLARRRPRAGGALLVAALAGAWALSTPWGAERLVRALEGAPRPFDEEAWRAGRDGPSPPRAIVVLGGGLLPADADGPWPDRPSAATVQRAVAAARVARLTGLPVLASGGQPVGGRDSEAGLMRVLLERDLGVPVRWTEEASRDTAENAACSAAILRAAGIGRVLLVTHAFHMSRARAAFEAAGIDAIPVPTDPLAGRRYGPPSVALLPSAEAAAVVALSIRELLGLGWQSLARPSVAPRPGC
ncbi:MAG: putative exported protein [Pseudomonadota bacterium]